MRLNGSSSCSEAPKLGTEFSHPTALRLLVKDLRVNSRAEILPTYRIVNDAVCALPSSVGGTCRCANQLQFRADRLDAT